MSDLVCRRNPASFDARYLENLNLAFGHWGDQALYDWVFRRSCGSFATDQLVLEESSGLVLAGSGVSYRKVRTSAGDVLDVGIMTGSWTVPQARGRGCFSRIIEESVALTRERGGAALLAFVTENNLSRRALERAGAYMLPSGYWTGLVLGGEEIRLKVRPSSISAEAFFDAYLAQRQDVISFWYPEITGFIGQILSRPLPTRLLTVGTSEVVVEEANDTDRILAVVRGEESPEQIYAAVVDDAGKRGRKAFAFSMGEIPAGVAGISGYLTIIPCGDGGVQLGKGNWAIDSGERM